ncbi:MAG: 4'-phosphopantetheinyl transferase superfamily protein [Bacteroidales bacterium]
MGLVMKKNVQDDCLLGIWEINEDFFTLFNMLKLNDEEIEKLNSFKSYNRKLEWLSVRVLLVEMTGPDVKIFYNSQKKPFLTDESCHISISHSNKLTSIILSRKHRVGLDLEYVSNKIASLAGKFLTPPEEQAVDSRCRKYHVYIYWCAKEALYKICDKQNINFREDIIIDPFMPAREGTLTGKVHTDTIRDDFVLQYFKYQNYTIVWCCK